MNTLLDQRKELLLGTVLGHDLKTNRRNATTKNTEDKEKEDNAYTIQRPKKSITCLCYT